MSETLRIKLTRAEARQAAGVVAYEFAICDAGVVVRECWAGYDEVYSNALSIVIPSRIWAIAAPWLAERASLSPKEQKGD